MPRAAAARRTSAASAATEPRADASGRMLQKKNLRTQGERPPEPEAGATKAVERSGGPVPVGVRQTNLARERGGLRSEILGRRLDVERERHREVLNRRQRFEQDGPLGDDAEAIDDREPVRAVGDVGRRRPNIRTSPESGSAAPVMRLISISAAGRSRPRIADRSPGARTNRSTRSGRRPR